jgi:hypothetical protein
MKSLLLLALLALVCPLMAQVKVTSASDRIMVEIDGKPFGDLIFGGDTYKPYFHPLRSATGKIVSRRYPMEMVEGEPRDHNHHRGLFFGHLEVNGIDFWSNDPLNKQSPRTGKTVIRKVNDVKSGKKSGSLTATFDWNHPDGHTMLTETRTMTFYSDPKLRIIDFDTTLMPKEKLHFADDKDGLFALRVAPQLEEPNPKAPPNRTKGTGVITNAEGLKTEKEVWGKRSNWADYFGTIDGEQVGFAIFDHPQNPGHPTRWHARGYGLFSANPMGSRTFDKNNPEGGMHVEANQPVRFRYRVVIHPAGVDLADMYKKYEKTK